MASVRKTMPRRKVSATSLQNFLFLFIGLLVIGTIYTFYMIGLTMGETYVEMEEDTYNPNILDTIKWSHAPAGWEEMSFFEIRRHFKCKAHGRDQTKPLPSLDEWNTFRQRWKEIVDPNAAFDEVVPPTQGYAHDEQGNPPPFYPKQSEGKGRGLFASRDIKKGEMVWNGDKSASVFPDAMSFRRYIFSLPRKMACDIEEWPWTQKLTEDGPMRIVVALDISTLMNSGGSSGTANVLPKANANGEYTGLQGFATRDIKKGEEILEDYSTHPSLWKEAGL